jgi:hypothetical protein
MNSQNLESNNIISAQTNLLDSNLNIMLNQSNQLDNNLSDSNLLNSNLSDSNLFKKTYTLVQKKKLADRIENLKSKKQFKQIFKIIYESSDNSYTKDSSGVYINFNSLSNETIKLIEDYLNIIAPKIDNIPLQSKYTPYFSDEYNPKDSGIKLSNHEKNFLKHVGHSADGTINPFRGHSTDGTINSERGRECNSSSNVFEGNDSDVKNNFIESESSLKNSDQNKTKILVKPFTFE